MKSAHIQRGFSLVELLVAATVFTFVMAGISQLFAQAIDLQRRAAGYQKIQENAQFVLESIAREVRVSTVRSPSGCDTQLIIEHPVNGTVTYIYDDAVDPGMITRSAGISADVAEPITSADVHVAGALFCVTGAGVDGRSVRVTMPMTFEAISGKASGRVSASLQTTIVSRDLTAEFAN